MPKIDIERPHRLGLAAARVEVERVASALQQKFGVGNHWQGNVLQLSGTGVAGAIAVTDESVRVTAQLGMLLSPLKGRIERDILQQLEQHFV